MALQIRPITDYQACEYAQVVIDRAWGGVEPIFNVATHILIAVPREGGVLLGAYADDGPAETGGMVGVAMGWLACDHDPDDPPGSPLKIKLYSHLAGVLPALQGQHIGLRLKLAQREAVLEQGLTDWMTWTYDPLLRRNAVFNLHRLGASTRTYTRNVFGEQSDRCQVNWRLRSPEILQDIDTPRPTQSWETSALQRFPRTTNADNIELPVDHPPSLENRTLAIPLPSDIAAIRRADSGIASEWRLYLRDRLEQAFAAGYTLVDCVHFPQLGWHYILTPS